MRILTLLAVIAVPVVAHAQSTTANVPTGYQVPGCTHYKLEGGRVIQICPEQMSADERLRAMVTPGDPAYIGTTSPDGAGTK